MVCQLKGLEDPDLITDQDRSSLKLLGGKIYSHKRLQVHYTTYDLRRDYDTINPSSITNDVMVLASDDDERQMENSPFWYARVIGVFHANVVWKKGKKQRIEFVWVRWYGREEEQKFGDKEARLEKVGFITDDDDTPCFGFIHPQTIVRAIHLIPDFGLGKTDEFMDASPLARSSKNDSDIYTDWVSYFVNR